MGLSRNSYLESKIHVFLYKLVVVNTFDGFLWIEFDQTLDIFLKKKSLFFIQITAALGKESAYWLFDILQWFVVRFVVILRQSCQTLPKKSPNCPSNHRFLAIFKVTNTIWLHEPSTSGMSIRCALDIFQLKSNDFLECFWCSV